MGSRVTAQERAERIRDELQYALACQRLGMKAMAAAAFRRATLLREATPTD